jgi:hypothetical protein
MLVLPLAVMLGDGGEMLVMVMELFTLPQALLAVTVYVPPLVTVMESFMEPVDHV